MLQLTVLTLALSSSAVASSQAALTGNGVDPIYTTSEPISTSISLSTGRYTDPIVGFRLGPAGTEDPSVRVRIKACVDALKSYVALGCRSAILPVGVAQEFPLRELTGVKLSPWMALLGRLEVSIGTRRLPPDDYGPSTSQGWASTPLRLSLTR